MSVSITFAGSGDSFGSGGRFNTRILVDAPGIRFCIDFGHPVSSPSSNWEFLTIRST